MIRARSSIDATRLSRDQMRVPPSDPPAGEPPRADSAMRPDRVPRIQEMERKKSPTAPLCDDTTSLRLSQAGQRVERFRIILQATGNSTICLSGLIGGIVAAINGGGLHTENTFFAWATGGAAIGGVLLLLVGFLVGRHTSDWWHPRMRETIPTSEHEAKRRLGTAKSVRGQIRTARKYERRVDGGGTLLTEPILILHGRRREDLTIFDQEGNELGSVVRV